jgi:tetratricopeptide (TPR) repeat protein
MVVMTFSGLSIASNAVWENKLSLGTDVAKRSPRSSRAHNRLGNAYDEVGLVDEARREYELALRLDPGHVGARINLGNAWHKLGRMEDAVREYRSALSLHPDATDRADAYNGLGSALLALGRAGEALPLLLQARDLRQESANIRFNLGEAYSALGSYDEAIASFTAAIALDPRDAYAYHSRGRAQERTGRYRDAIDDYRTAVMLKPDLADAVQDLRNVSGMMAEGGK